MKKEREHKNAVLIVAFGTSVPEAAVALHEVENRVRKSHREMEVRWAYTSKTIRSRFAAGGKTIDSPETALSRLMGEGYTHVGVLSLHVVPGKEFHDLFSNAMRFAQMRGGFEKIRVARPLLGNHEDLSRVADALCARFSLADSLEGVVFIGHGNRRHPSDALYIAMDSLLRDRNPNLFAGTVQGNPSPEQIIPKLRAAGIRKVRLIPLMTTAGDHVRKDMAGDIPGSWKSLLAENSIESDALISGLVEYPEIVDVWMDHLHEIV
ncbi:MAG: sirohydrochlorin cobaltochelatase, partial [Syntrophobacteraceae bacterium]